MRQLGDASSGKEEADDESHQSPSAANTRRVTQVQSAIRGSRGGARDDSDAPGEGEGEGDGGAGVGAVASGVVRSARIRRCEKRAATKHGGRHGKSKSSRKK